MSCRAVWDPYEPEWVCESEERLGNDPFNGEEEIGPFGDGSKFVCGVSALRRQPCLVYSIGNGADWGFEQAMKRAAPSCEIHTFDPGFDYQSAKSVGMMPLQNVSKYSTNHAFALAGRAKRRVKGHAEGRAVGRSRLRSWLATRERSVAQLMSTLGHVGRRLDVLKVDCEGCEWGALVEVFASVGAGELSIGQVQVELHAKISAVEGFVGSDGELRALRRQIDALFAAADAAGFFLFHKERNAWGTCNGYLCLEYALVHSSHACAAFVDSHCPQHAMRQDDVCQTASRHPRPYNSYSIQTPHHTI